MFATVLRATARRICQFLPPSDLSEFARTDDVAGRRAARGL